MTKKIVPQFTRNRSAGNAYGCGCCCNKQWGNFAQDAVLRKTWEMYADVPVSDIQTILQIVTLRMKI